MCCTRGCRAVHSRSDFELVDAAVWIFLLWVSPQLGACGGNYRDIGDIFRVASVKSTGSRNEVLDRFLVGMEY